MATTTPRLGLPAPALTDAADIATAVKPLADALDAIALAYDVGLLADRPAAADANGRVYYATDVGIMAFSDGANWQRLDLDALNRIITLEAETVTTTDVRLGAPGDLIWSAAVARAGSLLCDGTSYLRSAYADLFAALGGVASPWGLPDGTHFKVPDLRGRVPIMAGAGAGLTARALAATGGEESHLLTAAESGVPAHGHPSGGSGTTGVDSPDHAHVVPGPVMVPQFSTLVGAGSQASFGDGGNHGLNSNGANARHAHSFTDPATPANAAADAAGAHANMQPWAAVNCFVKT